MLNSTDVLLSFISFLWLSGEIFLPNKVPQDGALNQNCKKHLYKMHLRSLCYCAKIRKLHLNGPSNKTKTGPTWLSGATIQYLRLSKGAEMVAMADYLPHAALNLGLLKDYYSEECIKATVKILISFESFLQSTENLILL